LKLVELSERTGLSARQVRYLIAEKFIPPPAGGRAHARYGAEHVAAIRRYSQLRDLGFTPASIRILLQGGHGVPFPVADGVTLTVAPELVASGVAPNPLVSTLEALLRRILGQPRAKARHPAAWSDPGPAVAWVHPRGKTRTMNERTDRMSTAAWRRGRGAPTPWMMRPVLPPLHEYGAVPSFRERAPLDPNTIRALWHQHMSGSPVRMDRDAARMRLWMRTNRDGVLTQDEETALHDFFEALRGIDLFAFRQSCGASIYEIARVMHIIECRAHYAVGWMRQYLYEDWDDEWRAG